MTKKTKKIYCVHSWYQEWSGGVVDSWRVCNRCDTRWDSIGKKKIGGFFDFPTDRGVYGKEPEVVIGVVK